MHSKFAVHTIFFCMILKNLPRVFLVSTPGSLRATQRATRDRFLDELGIAFSNCCSTTVQKGNIDCAHSPIQRDSENIPSAFFCVNVQLGILFQLGIAFRNWCPTTVNIDCAHSPIQRDSKNIPSALLGVNMTFEIYFLMNSTTPPLKVIRRLVKRTSRPSHQINFHYYLTACLCPLQE